MKKIILPAMLICLSFSVFARDERRPERKSGPDINILIGNDRELRECRNEADILRRDNRMLSDRLRSIRCDQNDNDRRRIDQLDSQNRDLSQQVNNLAMEVERLRIDNSRLELEAHPDRGGGFNLAEAITACSKIPNAVYSQQCAAAAKANSIPGRVIAQCSRITNAYYALECVKSAGLQNANSQQVEECVAITNAVYASQCVATAGEKRVRPDVIKSCISTSTNAYYQLECVKSM